MVSGREFNEFDLPSKPPVVIVNEAMARRFWRDGDAVGRSIHIGKKDYQIAGVVETGKYVSLHEAPQPYLFLPFTQVSSFECQLLVETAGDPRDLAPSILKATTAVDRNLPIVGAITLRSHMRDVLSLERAMAWLLLGLSILGMFLAAVGLFSTVSYAVSRRTHEIGVRMALGARRSRVLRLVLLQGLGEHGWSVGWSGRRRGGFAPALAIRLWHHRTRPLELRDQRAGCHRGSTAGIVLPGTSGDEGGPGGGSETRVTEGNRTWFSPPRLWRGHPRPRSALLKRAQYLNQAAATAGRACQCWQTEWRVLSKSSPAI